MNALEDDVGVGGVHVADGLRTAVTGELGAFSRLILVQVTASFKREIGRVRMPL